MQDNKIMKIISKLQPICPNGEYKVIDITELCSLLKVSQDKLDEYFKYLSLHEYIDVKYVDEKVYCFSLLHKSIVIDDGYDIKIMQLKNQVRLYLMFNILIVSTNIFMLIFFVLNLFKKG